MAQQGRSRYPRRSRTGLLLWGPKTTGAHTGPAGGTPGYKYTAESFLCQRDGLENRSVARGHGEYSAVDQIQDKPAIRFVRQEIKKPWRTLGMLGRT